MKEEKPWTVVSEVRTHGRSRVHTDCPFCSAPLEIYLWSLAGSGKKRCACGAALYRDGVARKETP